MAKTGRIPTIQEPADPALRSIHCVRGTDLPPLQQLAMLAWGPREVSSSLLAGLVRVPVGPAKNVLTRLRALGLIESDGTFSRTHLARGRGGSGAAPRRNGRTDTLTAAEREGGASTTRAIADPAALDHLWRTRGLGGDRRRASGDRHNVRRRGRLARVGAREAGPAERGGAAVMTSDAQQRGPPGPGKKPNGPRESQRQDTTKGPA